MQQLIINCQTGQAEVVRLNPEEEFERVRESELAKQLAEIQRRIEVKRLLVRELVELREMKQNRTLFDDTDIAEKQAEVDRLTSRLMAGNLPIV